MVTCTITMKNGMSLVHPYGDQFPHPPFDMTSHPLKLLHCTDIQSKVHPLRIEENTYKSNVIWTKM